MTPERWDQISQIFAVVVTRDPLDRDEYLEQACAGDAKLRSRVEELLANDEQANNHKFLDATSLWIRVSNSEAGELFVGRKIGCYEIEKYLGGGGMGDVYLAQRVEPYKKRVAIKFIKPAMDTEQMLHRFESEMQIHAALSEHLNIAGLMDAGATVDGYPYFVMEYVEGERIDDYCDSRKLSVRDRLLLFRSVLAAVQHAHQNLVVHLDLKPSNILVTKDGVPKLVDFGISKLLNPDLVDQAGTATGADGMTYQYASPEQVRRDTVITTASDLYSLGVVLYELLTGHRPYELDERSVTEIKRIVCEEKPEKPSEVVRRNVTRRQKDSTMINLTPEDISTRRGCRPNQLRRLLAPDIDKILLYALSKEPQRRFKTVAEFSHALRDWIEWRPVPLPPTPSLLYQFQCWCRRNPMVSGLTALIGLLILLVALVATVGHVQISDALAIAERTLIQETSFRQSLLETPSFKLRKQAVESVAKDLTLLELLDKTILETADLRDKLNVPDVDAGIKDKLKDQLQQHATRKKLQQCLKELSKASNQVVQIDNWFLLDSKGLFLAREPPDPNSVGENFAWRTYFHGGPRDYDDLQDYLDNAPGEHVKKPHLSAALESQKTGEPLWAVSAPVRKDEFLGVVGLRVKIGRQED